MSTFTRTTTPPYSANPFQRFDTYEQARRATKGASVVAWLVAALCAWLIGRSWLSGAFAQFGRTAIIMAIPPTLLSGVMGLLGWRIWVRPGPWKTFAILAFVAYDVVRLIVGYSTFNLVLIAGLAILGFILNVLAIAFRGALALKRLRNQIDLEVF
jgi:hypothetical protein